jgi:glutathione S-transferase
MRLYHVPRTRSVRVLWTLEESGAPYELVVLKSEERKSPEHLARHPLGVVPVLEDDQGFLFESGALCLQVADSYPDAGLIGPLGSHERGLVYQWLFFAMTELESSFGDHSRSLKAGDGERTAAAKERFHHAARVVDQALEGHEYLVADRFSVADILLGEFLSVCRRNGLTDGLTGIDAYIDRLEARPAFKRADAVEPA